MTLGLRGGDVEGKEGLGRRVERRGEESVRMMEGRAKRGVHWVAVFLFYTAAAFSESGCVLLR